MFHLCWCPWCHWVSADLFTFVTSWLNSVMPVRLAVGRGGWRRGRIRFEDGEIMVEVAALGGGDGERAGPLQHAGSCRGRALIGTLFRARMPNAAEQYNP